MRVSAPQTSPPFSLLPGAVEPYRDADAYALLAKRRTEDLEYYVDLCKGAARILDVGCGLGRLTIPLLATGAHVTGLDTSEALLARLALRTEALDASDRARLSFVLGDMRAYVREGSFDFVLAAGRTLCHLYTARDLRAFLKNTLQNLRPGGSLVFDVPLPRLDDPGYDPLAQIFVEERQGEGGSVLLTERWYQPQELLMHLHYAGFCEVVLGADFSRKPISPQGPLSPQGPISPQGQSVCVVAKAPERKAEREREVTC